VFLDPPLIGLQDEVEANVILEELPLPRITQD